METLKNEIKLAKSKYMIKVSELEALKQSHNELNNCIKENSLKEENCIMSINLLTKSIKVIDEINIKKSQEIIEVVGKIKEIEIENNELTANNKELHQLLNNLESDRKTLNLEKDYYKQKYQQIIKEVNLNYMQQMEELHRISFKKPSIRKPLSMKQDNLDNSQITKFK